MKENWLYVVLALVPSEAKSKVFADIGKAVEYLDYLENYTEARMFKGVEMFITDIKEN